MSRAAHSIERDAVATAALCGYSLVVAAGFARVFSGWGFFDDLALLVIAGHGTSFVLRRLRVSGWISVPVVTALLVWLVVVLQYRGSTSFLVPTGATWDSVTLEIGLVRDQFQTAVAPVIHAAGWATLSSIAVIVAVVMADAFAFQAEARGEALVPGGVLFVFIAALGSDRLRVWSAALLVAAGVIAVIALRWYHDSNRRVVLSPTRRAVSLVAPAAVASALALALMAGIVGPRVPGADAEPLYETRGRGGGITEVLSPLVDIRSRLTNRGNVELFRVNANAESYWRATTLPEFDGSAFRLPSRSLERVDGQFEETSTSGVEIRQQIQVLGMGGQLLPAAASPVAAEGTIELRFNRDTQTLVTERDLETNDQFTVESWSLRLSPEQLRAATTDDPPDDIYLDLPDGFPALVGEMAAQVTASAPTDYDAAIALQTWFRTGFDYSLEVQSGHGSDAILSFLELRVGYCEQFAATFAAMARTLGIPSRVAVGYTSGTLRNDGWYSVIGKNAHAWPELWFDGIGWVAFEPTPGRGAPGDESYTGVAAAQDTTGPERSDVEVADAPPSPTSPVTVIPPGERLPVDDPADLTAGIPDFAVGSGGTTASASDDGGVPWPFVIVTTLIAAALIAPWAVRRIRRRAARARNSSERVDAAWRRARAAVERAGVSGSDSMTAREWTAATASKLPVAARSMTSLADVLDRVTYAPPGTIDLDHPGAFGRTLGDDCDLWSKQIDRVADDTLTNADRVRRYFSEWN